MSLYDGIKDVAKIVQQADNIDLYRQLLDLSAQALELQAENAKLKEENTLLKKARIEEERLVWHKQPYLTMMDDYQQIKYCSVCWGVSHKLIQMKEMVDSPSYGSGISLYCHNCKGHCRPE